MTPDHLSELVRPSLTPRDAVRPLHPFEFCFLSAHRTLLADLQSYADELADELVPDRETVYEFLSRFAQTADCYAKHVVPVGDFCEQTQTWPKMEEAIRDVRCHVEALTKTVRAEFGASLASPPDGTSSGRALRFRGRLAGGPLDRGIVRVAMARIVLALVPIRRDIEAIVTHIAGN